MGGVRLSSTILEGLILTYPEALLCLSGIWPLIDPDTLPEQCKGASM